MRSRAAPRVPRLRWGPLLRKLESFYGPGTWRVPVRRERGADPFGVLVSTILSHRTRDEVTDRATRKLLKAYPTAAELAEASLGDISALITEVGLTRSKASGLLLAAKEIVMRHGGRVPDSEPELLNLPLVGRKTARAVLVFGFRQAAIPVDSHIQRVANRLGVVRTSKLGETADALKEVVPRKYWAELNPVLVQHGMNLCSPRSPRCRECPIERRCEKIGVAPEPPRRRRVD